VIPAGIGVRANSGAAPIQTSSVNRVVAKFFLLKQLTSAETSEPSPHITVRV
jgi:hypothetical protein